MNCENIYHNLSLSCIFWSFKISLREQFTFLLSFILSVLLCRKYGSVSWFLVICWRAQKMCCILFGFDNLYFRIQKTWYVIAFLSVYADKCSYIIIFFLNSFISTHMCVLLLRTSSLLIIIRRCFSINSNNRKNM